MKTTRTLFTAALLAAATLTGCNGDDEDTPEPQPATACSGMNFCMKVDGSQITKNATWRVIGGNRNRIYWEEGSGNNYKNIELDMYGTTTGTYTVVSSPSSGQGGFQYFTNDNGTTRNIEGQSGTIEVTAINGNTISGTFNVVGTDGAGTTYQITEGNFVSVPQ